MKKYFFLTCLIFLLSFTVQHSCAFDKHCPHIRVLIDEKDVEEKSFCSLSGQEYFVISDLKDSERRKTLKTNKLNISVLRGSVLAINGKRLVSAHIKIEPTKGTIRCGKYTYKGSFYIILDNNKLYLINNVSLEDYVECGVGWEMLPYWPSAALAAGAIAYRSYVIATIKSGLSKKKRNECESWYDIRCTPSHQVYKGLHHCQAVHQAVRQTRGLVLIYNNEPVLAQYDACCGGSIPSKRDGVDFNKAPYLARPYACTYCKPCKYYRWTLIYTMKELSRILGEYTNFRVISDIKISVVDQAGAVSKIKVKVRDTWIELAVTRLMSLLKEIKSCSFTISKRNNTIYIKGSGFGHQLGFCQWGAYGLAKKGWSYSRIVRYYYPNALIGPFWMVM